MGREKACGEGRAAAAHCAFAACRHRSVAHRVSAARRAATARRVVAARLAAAARRAVAARPAVAAARRAAPAPPKDEARPTHAAPRSVAPRHRPCPRTLGDLVSLGRASGNNAPPPGSRASGLHGQPTPPALPTFRSRTAYDVSPLNHSPLLLTHTRWWIKLFPHR